MGFHEQLDNLVKETEEIIYGFAPAEEGYQKTVFEAMNYSFKAGGKRLRPLIMHETFKCLGGNENLVHPFMAALEMIHTYSLIHDDLPEMDNDDLRRGKPTNHVVYGQAMAVLAGDGLLNYAFETALKAGSQAKDDCERAKVLSAITVLAKKAGVYGMIGGQCVDVEAEKKNQKLTEEQLLFTYENKTSALLEAAFVVGAILAGADKDTVDAFERAGSSLGLAFQLQDDILDITSTEEELGKPIGSDEKNGKVTYVSYIGMDNAVKLQKEKSIQAVEELCAIERMGVIKNGESLEFLKQLIKMLVDRRS